MRKHATNYGPQGTYGKHEEKMNTYEQVSPRITYEPLNELLCLYIM